MTSLSAKSAIVPGWATVARSGGSAALDRGREAGHDLVPGREIGDLDVRIQLTEAFENRLDRLLLRVTGPDAHQRDLA